MKKKLLTGCLGIIIIVLLLVSYFVYHFFYSMNNLPEGQLIKKSHSPNHTYTLNLYRADSGATSRYSIRGELIDNGNENTKNIYWGYDERQAKVSWKNNHVVNINGHILDVEKDKYDFRRE